MAKSIFISHSSKDDAIVRQIRQALESFKIEVWADSERLSGGDLLAPTIREAIEKADRFLAFLTLNGLNSEWVQREIKHAQSVQKRIVPLASKDVGIPLLRLLLGEEPAAIRLGEGPMPIPEAVNEILTAIGEQQPTEAVRRAVEKNPSLADLVLELKDPVIEQSADGARRAAATAELTYVPADGSPKVESERYRFVSPLGPIEAEEIRWYLERYINWPAGTFEDRAQRVVDALPQWGRRIYDAVNAPEARDALEAWMHDRNAERRFTVRMDKKLVAGSSQEKQAEADEAATLLLSLPWELIHDEHGFLFQGARPVRVRRSLPNRQPHAALATDPPIRVLLVSPRPEDESATYLDHRTSARPLVESLSRLGDLADFRLLDPPTFPALEKELERAEKAGQPYHVVHFDGHGVYDRKHGLGMLCFEDPADSQKLERRRSQPIPADKIAGIVRDYRIPLFFLEACQSAQAAADPSASVAGRLLESGVASVAAMSHSVLVETARRFIEEFYRELLSGKRVGQAMLAGQRALKSDTFRGKTFSGELRLEDWFVPVLFQEETDPQLITEMPAQHLEASIEEQRKLALGDLPDEPAHHFLGRSRDLLKAERILSQECYLVVKGSGGEGKTTFAAELARWLVATRRFARVAFTSVEQITEARQLMFSIGAQLVPNFAGQAGIDDDLGLQLIERALREHLTLLLIDNVESILASPDTLAEILDLCSALNKAGQTRIVFTTREPLPAPFAANVLPIGRLDRDSAIRLLSNVLSSPPETETTEDDLEKLVQAVGGHARSLVLIGREVGLVGVHHAAENLREVMLSIEAKHSGERENSLLASAELSLRRLPAEIRPLMGPLSAFQGGAVIPVIGLALSLDETKRDALVRALIGVGLAEYVEPAYLRFDPALVAGDMTADERDAATSAWSEAVAGEIGFLYDECSKNTALVRSLTLLDLPNLLVALEHLARSESPERIIRLATRLESLVQRLNRPKVLARLVEIRATTPSRLDTWSNGQFEATRASIERLSDQGRAAEAVEAARALYVRSRAAGEAAYPGADYDTALTCVVLGRALQTSGEAEAALPHLMDARRRFERLNEAQMAGLAITKMADCLSDLGRYSEAAEAYLQAIKIDEELHDQRSVAVDKFQLASTRFLEKNYAEALPGYHEALAAFSQLGELSSVAAVWHQIGMVYQETNNFEEAERAYQRSLAIKVQIGNRAAQASTLGQMANLYGSWGRPEDAVRFHRQSADAYVELGDRLHEGLVRNNIAPALVGLKRYAEARIEIELAIECKTAFGHVGQPWKTFANHFDLETAEGNQAAAIAASDQAIAAYLSYRRDGGAPEIDIAEVTALVQQDPDGARAAAADPNLQYRAAAEILLALEQLEGQSESATS